MNINSIRGKKLELLAFLDFHQPHVVAIQETKIDSSIATSELFRKLAHIVYIEKTEISMVMLLVHKDISHMPITELENDSESIWVKVIANKTSHFVASWYRPPGSTSEEFQLFREQLDYIRTHHKGKKLPSAHVLHVLGDFNFKDIDWPDRLNKLGSTLSQSEGQILIDIMNDHGLEQMVHFPSREKNTLDFILTSLPGQFQDVHSPDKLSDHDIVSGTLKIFIPSIKKLRRKVYLYQKGDYGSM